MPRCLYRDLSKAVRSAWGEGMHRQSCLTSEAARTTSHPRLRKEACSRSEITPLSLMVRRKDDENSKGRKLPDKHTGPQLHSANGRPRCQNTGHRLVPGIPTIKYLAAFPGRQILMVHQGRRGRGQHGHTLSTHLLFLLKHSLW